MKKVGVTELRKRLSEYLRIAQAGEEDVVITWKGVPVADLLPPPEFSPDDPDIAMAEEGGLRLGRPYTKEAVERRERLRRRRAALPPPDPPITMEDIMLSLDKDPKDAWHPPPGFKIEHFDPVTGKIRMPSEGS